MQSFFGGGFDALHTSVMGCGDEKLAEQTKQADPGLVDTDDGGGMADPHGDVGCSSIAQAIAQAQHNDDDTCSHASCCASRPSLA